MVKSRNSLFQGLERSATGWSIAKIQIVASITALCIAVILQYIVIAWLAKDFSQTFEKEVLAKILAQSDTYRARIVRSIQSKNYQSLLGVTQDIFMKDASYLAAVFYDEIGEEIFQAIQQNLQQDEVSAITKALNSKTIDYKILESNKFRAFTRSTSSGRIMDVTISVILRSEYAPQQLGETIGYFRILADLRYVDKKILQFRIGSLIFVILTAAMSALAMIGIIQKTVIDPIERAIHFIEEISLHTDKMHTIKTKNTDAMQIRQLLYALEAGLNEISTKHKAQKFIEETRNLIKNSTEHNLLDTLRNIWIKTRWVIECHIAIAKYSASEKKYLIEKSTFNKEGSDRKFRKTHDKNKNISQTYQRIPDDFMIKFLSSEQEIYWLERILFVKSQMNIENNSYYIILVLFPQIQSYLLGDKYEQISILWLQDISKIYQEIHYKQSNSAVELSQELPRCIEYTCHEEKPLASDISLSEVYAATLIPCYQVKGDFLFTIKYPKSLCTLSIYGSVLGNNIKAGLIATALTSIIFNETQHICRKNYQEVVKNILISIKHYLSNTYPSQTSIQLSSLYFNHELGLGSFLSHGPGFCIILTPHERKPMIITQQFHQPYLSDKEDISCPFTNFSLYSGQILFSCTRGILDIENNQQQKFEKAILSGNFADITETFYKDTAETILNKYLEQVKYFAGNHMINQDLTALVLLNTKKPGDL